MIPADRVEQFTITVPAGTTAASPQRTTLNMRGGDIVGVELKVPPGHLGLTGFALGGAGERIVPRDSWIIANDDVIRWPLDPAAFPDRMTWQAVAYNTDVFSHSFYLTLLMSEYEYAAETGSGIIVPLVRF